MGDKEVPTGPAATEVAPAFAEFSYLHQALTSSPGVLLPVALCDWQQNSPGLRPLFEIFNTMAGQIDNQLQVVQDEMYSMSEEKQKAIEDLANARGQLLTAIDKNGGSGGRPRRITADPTTPFTGQEKDIVKRQQAYVNHRSSLVRSVPHNSVQTGCLPSRVRNSRLS